MRTACLFKMITVIRENFKIPCSCECKCKCDRGGKEQKRRTDRQSESNHRWDMTWYVVYVSVLSILNITHCIKTIKNNFFWRKRKHSLCVCVHCACACISSVHMQIYQTYEYIVRLSDFRFQWSLAHSCSPIKVESNAEPELTNNQPKIVIHELLCEDDDQK